MRYELGKIIITSRTSGEYTKCADSDINMQFKLKVAVMLFVKDFLDDKYHNLEQ